MKPIQQHKDPRITNISFDNFTGSISIITPLSDDDDEDDETKDLMLSTPQTNGGVDLFKPNHHLSLITQPILGARSRKKNKNNSLTNSRRSSYNDSPSLIIPTNRTEKFQYEKKHESFDSGVDFSLSTNSSTQYPQQHSIIHRPLSALNEDLNPDDGFYEQHIRIFDRNPSIENQEQSNDISQQQYRSVNDLSSTHTMNNRKQNKISRKKSKLNIIDEQIQSMSRTPSGSNNLTTSNLIRINNSQIKQKAITPLGHYPNQEQIRAHINRSVIERQHPPYLLIPSQKNGIQHVSPSKFNNLPYRQQKQLGDRNNQEIHLPSFRQTKQTLPSLYNGEIIESRRKGIKINDNHKRQDQIDNFLTSTPRRQHERDQSNGRNINRSKPTGFVIRNKNRIINRNTEFESENSLQKPQFRSKNIVDKKSPIESINNLLQTTRIQPININNLRQENPIQKNTNNLFQTRSPTSWSIISDHDSPPPSNNKSTRTYRLILINEHQQQQPLLDGRHVIPTDNSQIPSYIDSPSKTSSPHTYPFNCASDSNTMNENSPRQLTEYRSCSSLSSLECFSPNDRFPLPLGKLTIATKEDDLSTNYDSNDGWSDDSAELIYADERYVTQKKKKITSSLSTHIISQR